MINTGHLIAHRLLSRRWILQICHGCLLFSLSTAGMLTTGERLRDEDDP